MKDPKDWVAIYDDSALPLAFPDDTKKLIRLRSEDYLVLIDLDGLFVWCSAIRPKKIFMYVRRDLLK